MPTPHTATIGEVEPTAARLSQGRAALSDRALGATGLACADCHALVAQPSALRPAPPLPSDGAPRWGGRRRSLPVAMNLCVERFLGRPALTGALAEAVVAYLTARHTPATSPPPRPTSGRGVYEGACLHCHEDGPAPALVGRPWSPETLTAYIRGAAGPAHPGRLMPGFSEDRLSTAEVEVLIRWLEKSIHRQPPW